MFGREWDGGVTAGFIFALILALWAIFNIVQNDRTGPLGKSLWSVAVLFLPFLGFVGWLIFGPKATKKLSR